MAKKRVGSSIKRSRTRSGCVTCRDRHIKCDEQQPVCRNCIKSKRKCYRGIRLNFTQYTLYNPNERSRRTRPRQPPNLQFRILDQSITIASLYDKGRRSYKPYLHLHTEEDLRESDLQFQQDMYSFYPSSSSVPLQDIPGPSNYPNLSLSARSGANRNTISENYQISNQLLQESYFKSGQSSGFQLPNQEFQPNQLTQQSLMYSQPVNTYGYPQSSVYFNHQLVSQPFPIQQGSQYQQYRNQFDPTRFHYGNLLYTGESSNKMDSSGYIHLLEIERYYWLLDLTNDLDLWKSIIPSLCVKAAEQDQDLFLLDCLINCSNQRDLLLEKLTQVQLEKWHNFRSIVPLCETHLPLLETLLASVCLILLSIYLRVPQEQLTGYHRSVLNNQVRLFNKVVTKAGELLRKKSGKTVVVIGCIHSVSILKYLLTRKYTLDNRLSFDSILNHDRDSFKIPRDSLEDIDEEIQYPENNPLSYPVDMSSFVNLTQFDKHNLNNSFSDFDFLQLKFASDSKKEYKSDAFKLREYFWYLIKLTYIMNNPEAAQGIEIDYNFFSKHENPASSQDGTPQPHINSFNILPNYNLQDTSPFIKPLSGSHSSTNDFPFLSDRHTVCAILTEVIAKLLNQDNQTAIQNSNCKIRNIFDQIDSSLIDSQTKLQWKCCFGWAMLGDNSNV
ncbi:uncharacterized protein SPAPADRAFT_67731 [Spathaspora passalidarum NRRL Y-27907]|uniref:Zn(2)-C6 fungal-type domain-containing protein n=1 Tax=Spathaspora passalidarum (strain NRRL Y-27907 / 11-Y1) TaxID=619300 RepID=G3AR41_SPAPN|nr:uncharacterized protein SPAPADRAFT_67731 [Spathaspora passalidarum NRRL Y-27907]EGW31702.1 hypothetical protein SPAPADRAFT_67731 [Spathaspora passalidarum NRRL Y-27907]